MRVGDLVRFKTSDLDKEWRIGLLVRYDRFTKVAEIVKDDSVFYAPGRLVETYQRGLK
jgi:hypothetical protein